MAATFPISKEVLSPIGLLGTSAFRNLSTKPVQGTVKKISLEDKLYIWYIEYIIFDNICNFRHLYLPQVLGILLDPVQSRIFQYKADSSTTHSDTFALFVQNFVREKRISLAVKRLGMHQLMCNADKG